MRYTRLTLTIILVISLSIMFSSLIAPVLAQPVRAQTSFDEYWYRYGPYIDKITFTVMKDYTMRLLAFEARELSMIAILPMHLERLRSNRPDAHIFFIVGFSTAGGLHFNVQLWPVKYFELRAALAHLWNRDRIIAESPLRGLAVKCTTLLPPAHGAWVNWDADFEKLYPYDPEKAKSLLAKIFTPCTGPDGRPAWCDPREGGRVVEIEILSLPEATSPTYWWIAQYIKSEAEAIGLRVTIKAVSSRELDAAIAGNIAQAWIIGWGLTRYPTLLYYFFHSSEIRPGGWNEWRVNDSRLDAILDRFYSAKDMEEAKEFGWRAQEILVNEIIPWIPTYSAVSILALDGEIDRDSVILTYAPPAKEPVVYSVYWWWNIRFKDRKFGGTFKYYHTVDITTYHPATWIWSTEGEAILKVYYPLTFVRPENIYLGYVPIFLKNYRIDRVEYGNKEVYKLTITLFDGIKWQDGVEMTAEDYVYTIMKFGKELKTRWYYGPHIEKIIDMKTINKTTLEVYLEDYGWMDLYSLTEYEFFIVLPKHVFERLPNPLEDPSTLPHPTTPGLTAMVGNGPFALVRLREVAYSELVWNPWYFYRHPERKVHYAAVSVPATVSEGSAFKISVTLTDYLDHRATNASVTVRLVGPIALSLPATHVSAGVYEVSIPGLRAGTYTVEIYAEQPIMLWSVDNKYVTTLTVGAVAPVSVGPVIERPPPIVVEVPGVPPVEIAAPPVISLSAPEVKITMPVVPLTSTEAVLRTAEIVRTMSPASLSYVAVALSAISLAIAVAVRKK
ncbi:MAG: ABC transporter substrate-binding protein [Sulfolobales archaeon]